METKRSGRRERQETILFPVLFIRVFQNIAFVFQEIAWLQKFKTLEQNEKMDTEFMSIK